MKVLKILGIVLLVIVGLVVALLLLIWRNNTKPLCAADYYEKLRPERMLFGFYDLISL